MRYISLKMSCGIYFKWPWVRKVIDSGDHVARSETAWGALIASQSAKAPLGLGQKNWPVESHSRAGHFWWDPSVFFFSGYPMTWLYLTSIPVHTPMMGRVWKGAAWWCLRSIVFWKPCAFHENFTRWWTISITRLGLFLANLGHWNPWWKYGRHVKNWHSTESAIWTGSSCEVRASNLRNLRNLRARRST